MCILEEVWLQIIDLKTICPFQVITLYELFLLYLVAKVVMEHILISVVLQTSNFFYHFHYHFGLREKDEVFLMALLSFEGQFDRLNDIRHFHQLDLSVFQKWCNLWS